MRKCLVLNVFMKKLIYYMDVKYTYMDITAVINKVTEELYQFP